MLDLSQLHGFDWDEGNKNKNWIKHKVTDTECEEVFFNQPLLMLPDVKHSETETRYHALGKTDNSRLIFLAFTTRAGLIRVIFARDMHKKERIYYEQKIQKDPTI